VDWTEIVASRADRYYVSGVSIACSREDPWTFGVVTAGGDPITPHTVFQACSISKHVAAFGTVRLVDQGVLALDEDISAYLTSWRLPASDGWQPVITLRQLLSHTAGLSYNWFRGFPAGAPVPTMLEVLDGAGPANTPPVRASLLPGSRFRYSGSHYAVLQQLLVDVTGVPFAELMRAQVFEPLGMLDSSYDQDFPHTHPAAIGHHVDGTQLDGRWRTQPEQAGAGLWTTPADLSRLGTEIDAAAKDRSPLLSGNLARDMLTPQVPGGYGLGTEVDKRSGLFGHSGSNIGYACWSYTWPEHSMSMTVMANTDRCDELLLAILTATQQRYGTHPTGTEAGTYHLRDGYSLEIAPLDGHLTVRATGQPPAPLRPLPGGRYRVAALDCELTFDGDTLTIHHEHDTQTATRSPSHPDRSA
jgi:CubicO group peptidase (beta-lactamase class C family)